jgi:hypothetical protein
MLYNMAFSASAESSSKTPALTLGEALAILAIERRVANGNHGHVPPLSAPGENYLQALRERAQALSLPENFEVVFNALPVHRCETEKTFLAENEDFFLAYFLASSNPANGGNACLKLLKHLNDCFECFEEFSAVLQNYYHKFQELSNDSSGNMTN